MPWKIAIRFMTDSIDLALFKRSKKVRTGGTISIRRCMTCSGTSNTTAAVCARAVALRC